MAVLHNRVSRKELKERALADNTPRSTFSFYQYTPISDPKDTRDEWYREMNKLQVFGRIYIAHEGVNAQISVPTHFVKEFRTFLYSQPGFNNTRLNKAIDQNQQSFFVLDIKVRNKIVADGIEDPAFDMQNKGGYVNAEQFNAMTSDPGTVIVDMRNHYEYEVGHFKDAIEVPSDTFRDQLPMVVDMLNEKKDQNIIMYCTGGIRCEKASAWMLHNGFKNVFHLEGGIINYTQQAKENKLENKFIGKNFVFDERLGERVTEDILAHCHICGNPCDVHVNCANSGCHLLFIQCDNCKETLNGCCSKECADFIRLPDEVQRDKRKGVDKGRNVFNKSKQRIDSIKSQGEK